jgi:aminoglycoside phosphotransferase family enzyme/predicted kinase
VADGSASQKTEPEQEVLDWLCGGGVFGDPDKPVIVETHAALIFLVGDRAWKLKKPVRLNYLDFSTPELRRAALEAEFQLNRRTAPELYLGVHKVCRANDGTLKLNGDGKPIEWLLEMKRFPDGALLAEYVERAALPDQSWINLADDLAAFHALINPSNDRAGAKRLNKVAQNNANCLSLHPNFLQPAQVRQVTTQIAALLEHHAPLLDSRAAQGRVRRGHGDLHLGNIAVVDGRAVFFDCLEFDEELATNDVLYDLAFLLMDLWTFGYRREANLLLNRYLDRSEDDEPGLSLIPLFMSVRATVRAHVLATLAAQGDHPDAASEAQHYLDAAEALLVPSNPVLIAIGGLSGSGKSTVAREVAAEIGGGPGARIIRSDVIRKRLAGVAPETRLAPSSYTEGANLIVYREIGRLAAGALRKGSSVIVDAVFGRAKEKADIAVTAALNGSGFEGFWLDVDDHIRVDRITRRTKNASDATIEVALRQAADKTLGPHRWHRLEAGADSVETAKRIISIVRG